jgi:hypothetical protein
MELRILCGVKCKVRWKLPVHRTLSVDTRWSLALELFEFFVVGRQESWGTLETETPPLSSVDSTSHYNATKCSGHNGAFTTLRVITTTTVFLVWCARIFVAYRHTYSRTWVGQASRAIS